MNIKLVYIGILGLIVTFVTLPQVLALNDTLGYCEGNGLVLIDPKCIDIDGMYTAMNTYFIVAIIMGIFGMLMLFAGFIALDKEERGYDSISR